MTPEAIANAVAQAIRGNEFRPGAQLVQDDLAKRFSVSRNPVREALRMLAADGLVVITPGAGAVVRTLSMADLDELYDIRLALELQVAPHIVDGATNRAITALRTLNEAMQSAVSTVEWMRLNFEFHTLLYSMAGRPHTEDVLRRVFSAVQPYSFQNVQQLDGRGRSDRAHADIVDALQDRDADRLLSLFRNHLETTRSGLAELYSAMRQLPTDPANG